MTKTAKAVTTLAAWAAAILMGFASMDEVDAHGATAKAVLLLVACIAFAAAAILTDPRERK